MLGTNEIIGLTFLPMHILLLGNGAREHALALWLARSPRVEQIHWAGHNGAPPHPKILAVDLPYTDPQAVANYCRKNTPQLVLAGGEAPLCAGVGDAVREMSVPFFGPGRLSALLEGSKIFAKEKMTHWGVPTAAWHRADSLESAEHFLRSHPDSPWVVKADGLAAGKGVIIAQNTREALQAARAMIAEGVLGAAGSRLVIEEFLQGEEISIHVLLSTSASHSQFAILPLTQDHKRLGEGDTGPNTGGMGAYGPVPNVTTTQLNQITQQIIHPVLNGLRQDGMDYRGVLYVGAMITAHGPRVLEFNCRFGDPECQVLVHLIANDPLEVILPVANGQPIPTLSIASGAAACVVIAAAGYPANPRKGDLIQGLDLVSNSYVYHAGTMRDGQSVLTNGGRVLSLVHHADALEHALSQIYADISRIHFPGMQYRRDIGHRALQKNSAELCSQRHT